MLGRERLGERERGLHVVGEHLRRSPRSASRSACVVADRHGQRALAVLGLGEQVERAAPRRRRPSEAITVRSLGPGEAVDADDARHLALGLLHVEAAGADDHVDARDRLGPVGERGDRLRAAHRGRPRRPRTARAAARITGCGGAATTTSSTPGGARGDGAHHDRGRVRVRGRRARRPPRGAPAPRAARTVWPSRQRRPRGPRRARPRRPRATLAIATSSPARTSRVERARAPASSSLRRGTREPAPSPPPNRALVLEQRRVAAARARPR